MKMAESISVSDAVRQGSALPWAYIRQYSTVTLGRAPDRLELDELLEARFFSETQEVRVFRGEDGLKAVLLEREDGDSIFTETYRLQNRSFGGEITVARILDSDEDGQTFVAATRLTGWKEAETHG